MAFTVRDLRSTLLSYTKIRIYEGSFDSIGMIFKTSDLMKIPAELLDREIEAIGVNCKNTIDIGLVKSEKHPGLKSFDCLHGGDKVRSLDDGKIYDVYLWNGFGDNAKFELCLCSENSVWPVTEFNPEYFEKVEE